LTSRTPARADRALLLRKTPFGDADVVATLLTEREGVIAALARNARASSPKKSMMLEPFHSLRVELATGSGELWKLRSAVVDVARGALLDDETRLTIAGQATRWVRTLSPPRVPEPAVLEALEKLLDRLVELPRESVQSALVAFGLEILEGLGYALELSSCARCGRVRPKGKAAYVGATQGGVVCESCRVGAVRSEIEAVPFDGALLDAIAEDPERILTIDSGNVARLYEIVRAAIDFRARAVGAKRGGA